MTAEEILAITPEMFENAVIESRDHFPTWLTIQKFTGIGVEIGTYYGQWAEHVLKNWNGNLIGVDPYINYPKEEYLDGCNLVDLEEARYQALHVLKPFGERFSLMRMPSMEAVLEFEDGSLDWVYLDGNHDYKHVFEDMNAWWPKVRRGGVLGGHDFMFRDDHLQRCGVEQAVKDFVASNPDLSYTTTPCSSWWIHK